MINFKNSLHSYKRRYQKGFSLIEILLTCVIFIVISIGTYQAMQSAQRVEDFLDKEGFIQTEMETVLHDVEANTLSGIDSDTGQLKYYSSEDVLEQEVTFDSNDYDEEETPIDINNLSANYSLQTIQSPTTQTPFNKGLRRLTIHMEYDEEENG